MHWIGRGDIKGGIRELERAVAINPQFGYAHLQLAHLYTEQGDFTRAEAAARGAPWSCRSSTSRARKASSSSARTRAWATSSIGWDATTDALKEYQTELLYLSASDHVLKERSLIELHQKLGAVYLRLDNAADARRHLDLAIRLFTERAARGESDPATAYYVGVAYALLDDVEHAVRYLQQAIEARGGQNRRRAAQDPDLVDVRPALEALGLRRIADVQIDDCRLRRAFGSAIGEISRSSIVNLQSSLLAGRSAARLIDAGIAARDLAPELAELAAAVTAARRAARPTSHNSKVITRISPTAWRTRSTPRTTPASSDEPLSRGTRIAFGTAG